MAPSGPPETQSPDPQALGRLLGSPDLCRGLVTPEETQAIERGQTPVGGLAGRQRAAGAPGTELLRTVTATCDPLEQPPRSQPGPQPEALWEEGGVPGGCPGRHPAQLPSLGLTGPAGRAVT